MKRATVVIPNWNGMRYLQKCLSSLRKQTESSFDIVLVDNGSEDGSTDYVRKHFPEVIMKVFPKNTGFCHAVNAGIRMSRTEYVILLNNDVSCDPGFVKALVDGIAARPRAFSCQARLLNMSEPEKMDDGGDYYCALGWAYALGKGKDRRRYCRPRRVFASCGGAAVYRRALLSETGLFDDRHFAYLEDIDLGYRARLAGYENWFLPEAVVYHAGSGSTGSRYNAFKVRLAARNSVYLIRKNMPAWQKVLNLPFLAAGFGIKTVFFLRKGYGKPYLGGLREGLTFSGMQYGDMFPSGTRLKAVRTGRVQLELWGNMLRLLASAFDKGETV